MKLSEVAKASRKKDDDHLRRSAGAGVAAGGGVLAATGYATGGIPGKKVTHTPGYVPRSGSATKEKRDVVRRFAQGGIFGSRDISHQEFADELKRLSPQSPSTKLGEFRASRVGGKLPPEEKIISHLRVGRRVGNVALVGGLAGVAGGLHMQRKKKPVAKQADVVKADKNRKRDSAVPGAMVGGGLTAAGIGHVVPMELWRQGRKWEATERRNLKAAEHLVPGMRRRGHPVGDYDKVNAQEVSRGRGKKIRPRGPSKSAVAAAGQLQGEASQAKYFAGVYRKHGDIIRAARGPGLAVAGVGAAGLGLQHLRRKPREMPNVAKQDGVFPFLSANIREEVLGIPETRRNPISPMQMLASSNIVAGGYLDLKSRNPLFRRRRTERGWQKIGIGAQMGVQPVGYGVMA